MRSCVQSNLGYAEFALSEVVAAQGKQLTRQLTGKDGKQQAASHTTIRAEEVANCKEMYRWAIGVRKEGKTPRTGPGVPHSTHQDDTVLLCNSEWVLPCSRGALVLYKGRCPHAVLRPLVAWHWLC